MNDLLKWLDENAVEISIVRDLSSGTLVSLTYDTPNGCTAEIIRKTIRHCIESAIMMNGKYTEWLVMNGKRV